MAEVFPGVGTLEALDLEEEEVEDQDLEEERVEVLDLGVEEEGTLVLEEEVEEEEKNLGHWVEVAVVVLELAGNVRKQLTGKR